MQFCPKLILATALLTSIAVAQTPTPNITSDPGYCGLFPLETGAWDPFWKTCKLHDERFIADRDGLPTPGFLVTTTDFVQGVAVTAAQGVYSTIMAVPYIILGTGVGAGLWLTRWVRRKKTATKSLANK